MQSINILEYVQENVLKSLFNKVAGLKDCWKTYLLHSYLRFYFSLGKTLKNQTFQNFFFLKHSWHPPPFNEFSKFSKKEGRGGGVSDFSHKKGGVGKIRFFLKKGGVSLIFILTSPFQCYLFLSVWCVCVFCLFTPFLSVLLVYNRKNLIL